MEHYRSTLATTAAAVLGLVAAHILHPGNFEVRPQPARHAPTATPPAQAWTDPPAELRRISLRAPQADTATIAMRTASAIIPGATAPIVPAEMAAPQRRPRVVAAAPKHRVVHRTAPVRQASLDGVQPIEASTLVSRDGSATRPDPIGALIRGIEAELGS